MCMTQQFAGVGDPGQGDRRRWPRRHDGGRVELLWSELLYDQTLVVEGSMSQDPFRLAKTITRWLGGAA